MCFADYMALADRLSKLKGRGGGGFSVSLQYLRGCFRSSVFLLHAGRYVPRLISHGQKQMPMTAKIGWLLVCLLFGFVPYSLAGQYVLFSNWPTNRCDALVGSKLHYANIYPANECLNSAAIFTCNGTHMMEYPCCGCPAAPTSTSASLQSRT